MVSLVLTFKTLEVVARISNKMRTKNQTYRTLFITNDTCIKNGTFHENIFFRYHENVLLFPKQKPPHLKLIQTESNCKFHWAILTYANQSSYRNSLSPRCKQASETPTPLIYKAFVKQQRTTEWNYLKIYEKWKVISQLFYLLYLKSLFCFLKI